ncbi:MAG: RHS repeat-associated core domain-containing protein [Candidatus Hydrogenedentes bacterium]|nr:RHS repeat-associated core domain-containing protein [Candidatus Hydrogenedentota bacterium]
MGVRTDYDGSHLDYSYDSQGRVTSMNDYHGNTTSYLYASDGKLSTITAPGSKTWAFSYDGYDRLTRVDIPNGMHTEYAFDSEGRRTSITHKDGSTVKQSFDYAFTDGNAITKITHGDGSLWEYEHDARKRLTRAERFDTDGTTLLHRYSYTYDAGDNLVTKAVLDNGTSTTTTTVFAYNSANEQTSMTVGGTTTTQAYDAWGRLTGRAQGGYSATYAFPPAADLRRYGDKLYSVTSDFPGEGDVTYEYGGDQKRRSRVAGASETWYNYDMGWNVLSEEDDADGATGALTATNVLLTPGAEVSALLADIAGASPASGAPRYYVTDHLGSTRGAYDASGAAAGTYEYSPYGGAYAVAGDALETLSASFTGKPWDADSNLYHFPYRTYSPERARWMTRDPLGMVDGPNVFTYVRANPVMFTDLLGNVSSDPGDLNWTNWLSYKYKTSEGLIQQSRGCYLQGSTVEIRQYRCLIQQEYWNAGFYQECYDECREWLAPDSLLGDILEFIKGYGTLGFSTFVTHYTCRDFCRNEDAQYEYIYVYYQCTGMDQGHRRKNCKAGRA